MSGEPLITIIGNSTSDAELRFTPQGVAVAAFTVAVTPRVKRGDEWADGETSWFRCTAWREMAESCAESIVKGTRLIVHGRFKTRQYEKDGQTRTSIEIDVEEVGPSLRYATAKMQKMSRSGGSGQAGDSKDPWASASPAGNQPADLDPPF